MIVLFLISMRIINTFPALLFSPLLNVYSFSQRLKLKIRDESQSSILVKCKAKNEVGLQQRACHYQITRARPPTLRHSCSLADNAPKSPVSFQVNCKPNELLKTEQFQMQSGSSPALSATNSAMSGNEMLSFPFWPSSRQAQEYNNDNGNNMSALNRIHQQQQQLPQQRVVFAPSWLLAELYKARHVENPSMNEDDKQQPQQQQGSTNYELVAYTIVAASDQLTRIKTLVEENKLFKENPRDIYYVSAKPPLNSGPNSMPNARDQQQLNSSAAAASSIQNDDSAMMLASLTGNRQFHPMNPKTSLLTVVEDPAMQLSDEFQFTVPSLQPDTRYKLIIHGQNLANKTRDWLVVRGETGPEDELSIKQRQQIEQQQQQTIETLSSSNKLIGSNLKQVLSSADQQHQTHSDTSNQSNGSSGAGHQKSIVMRSGIEQEEPLTSSSSALQHQQQQLLLRNTDSSSDNNSNQLSNEQREQLHADNNNKSALASRSLFSSLGLAERSGQLARQFDVYRENIIVLARKRPLLAIPLALIGCLLLFMLILYLSSSFVALIKGRRRHSNGQYPNGNEENTNLNNADDDDHSDHKSSLNNFAIHHSNDSSTSSILHSKLHSANNNNINDNINGPLQTNSQNQLTGKQQSQQHQQHHSHFSSSPGSFGSSSNGAATNSTSANIHTVASLSSPPQQQHLNQLDTHLQTGPPTIYTVDPTLNCQLLDAIALEPLASGNTNATSNGTCYGTMGNSKVYPVQLTTSSHHDDVHFANGTHLNGGGGPNGCQFIGSLDRRWQQNQHKYEPLYLTEQQMMPHYQFGSIDRRQHLLADCLLVPASALDNHNDDHYHQQNHEHIYAGQKQHRHYQQQQQKRHLARQMLKAPANRSHLENHSQHSKRVVAFDLSDGKSTPSILHNPMTTTATRSITSGESSSISVHTSAHVDSGHESPGTNTTNTTTTTNGPAETSLCQKHNNNDNRSNNHLPIIRAKPRRKDLNNNNIPVDQSINDLSINNNNNGHGNNNGTYLEAASRQAVNGATQSSPTCMMLMKMSPGSLDESSTTNNTLLQSADCSSSYASSINQQHHHHHQQQLQPNTSDTNSYSILQQNHRMATSFATSLSTADAKQQQMNQDGGGWA